MSKFIRFRRLLVSLIDPSCANFAAILAWSIFKAQNLLICVLAPNARHHRDKKKTRFNDPKERSTTAVLMTHVGMLEPPKPLADNGLTVVAGLIPAGDALPRAKKEKKRGSSSSSTESSSSGRHKKHHKKRKKTSKHSKKSSKKRERSRSRDRDREKRRANKSDRHSIESKSSIRSSDSRRHRSRSRSRSHERRNRSRRY